MKLLKLLPFVVLPLIACTTRYRDDELIKPDKVFKLLDVEQMNGGWGSDTVRLTFLDVESNQLYRWRLVEYKSIDPLAALDIGKCYTTPTQVNREEVPCP